MGLMGLILIDVGFSDGNGYGDDLVHQYVSL